METARQKFLRNHQENIRTMRAALLRAEREGDTEYVNSVRPIVEAWEDIGRKAQDQEDGEAE